MGPHAAAVRFTNASRLRAVKIRTIEITPHKTAQHALVERFRLNLLNSKVEVVYYGKQSEKGHKDPMTPKTFLLSLPFFLPIWRQILFQ